MVLRAHPSAADDFLAGYPGSKLVSGGSKSERLVRGPGRNPRFPDVHIQLIGGEDIFIQVGRTSKGGQPVAREMLAIDDLVQMGEVHFVDYEAFFLKHF